MENKFKCFIVPNNDLEAVTIINLLYENHVLTYVTEQQWGASWDNLSNAIKKNIDSCLAHGFEVYGVELSGTAYRSCKNVDHHYYSYPVVDDRTNEKSSLEQVAEIIRVKLTDRQQAIAIADKAFVGGLIDAKYSDAVIQSIVDSEYEILKRVQGITESHEAKAQEGIDKSWMFCGCRIVKMSHSKCVTVTRLMPMQEYCGGLLILSEDGEANYYGPIEVVEKLRKLGGWSDNADFTYWGCSDYRPNINKIYSAIKDARCK